MWAAVLSILKEIEWLGVGTLTIQLLVVFCLLLALFYARKWKLGLLPLFVALSTFPFLQTTLAITKYVAIYKDYKVSPGSIIIFTSTLFIVQLVYIFKDAIELRKLCTVLFASSILTTTLMLLFQGGDSFQEGRTPLGNVEVMAIWVMAVGNVALMLDLFLIPAIYEVSGRRLTLLPVWARILLTMCSVSAIDSAIFILVGFYNSWNIVDAWILFKHLLLSAIVGKVVASCALTPILWLYLRWFEYSEDLGRPEDVHRKDLINLFKYLIYVSSDYQPIRDKYSWDKETGVFTRRWIDSSLPAAIEESERNGNPLSVCLFDIRHAHPAGVESPASSNRAGIPPQRRLMQSVAEVISKSVSETIKGKPAGTAARDDELKPPVCLTNVHEFQITLPDMGSGRAKTVANQILDLINSLPRLDESSHEPFTATGCYVTTDDPEVGLSESSMMKVARGRLNFAKKHCPGMVYGGGNPNLNGNGNGHYPKQNGTAHSNNGNHNGLNPVSTSAISPVEPSAATLDSLRDEIASLHAQLREKEKSIAELKSQVGGPSGSSLVFDKVYGGFVDEVRDDEVIVCYTTGKSIKQTYGLEQFPSDLAPQEGERIFTHVRIYKAPDLPDRDDDYEPAPRETIRGRVEL